MSGSQKWLNVFNKAIRHLRIQSKHAEKDPNGEGIKLKLWTSQRMVLEKICEGLDNDVHIFVILKSRQLGVTTITLAIILFWLALHPNTIGIYVADNEGNAEKARTTIKKYVESWDSFMGKSFAIAKNNKHTVGFSNGSRLDIRVAGKTKTTWGEGEGYLVGHLTEISKYGQATGIDSFRHAMAPNNPRALYVFESTAFGVNHFQTLWEEANADPSTMMPIFVGWWANDMNVLREFSAAYQTYGNVGPTPAEQDLIKIVRDRYDYEITMPQLAWKRWQEAHSTSGAADSDQNQPYYAEQAFVESGFSFYQVRRVTDRMQEISDTERGLPVEEGGYAYLPYRFLLGLDYHLSQVEFLDANLVTGEDVTLRIWEKPQDGAMYAIGFDPAFGRNDYGNNHSVSVWRCFADKLVQVAEYAENDVTTVQAAWVLAWLAGRYFPCMVNIDLTGGLGLVVMQEFSNLRSRMQSDWYRDRIGDGFDDFLAGASWYLYHRMDSPGPGFMYGSKMSHDLKFKMMNQHRDAWVSDLLEIRSVPMLREMLNIRQTGPDIGAAAQGREKDDRTFASALACMTWVEHIRPGQIANGITWKSETMREQGTATAASIKINRMVQSVLVSANEEPDYRPPRTFLGDRGLV